MDLQNAKSIELSDKKLFEQYFKKYPPKISEFTFTNLFIWRNYYELKYIEIEGHLVLFSEDFLGKWEESINGKDDNDMLFFLPPIGESPDSLVIKLFQEFDRVEIRRVPEKLIETLKENKEAEKLNLKFQDDRDNWDYVYKKEDLLTLSGNKYRSKRRLLEKFQDEYDYEFHLVDEDLIEKCRELQNKWCIINECQKNKDLKQEQQAIFELFEHFTDLNVNGGLIIVDNNPAGYTFGEQLNPNTGVIHLEKAHTYYEGSYQAINNMFLEHCCPENIKYVNREQDLGISGLRKAKKSYHPEYMVKKSIIYRSKEG
jgi:uncharacterized protein